MSDAALHERLVALETELHQPICRANRPRLDELLHDDFIEIGRSGRIFRKTDILELLPSATECLLLSAHDFKTSSLAEDVALVTYCSADVSPMGQSSRHALRSSLWQRTHNEWQMRFHQGTPMDGNFSSLLA